MKNCRGDITIALALVFAVVTLSVILSQRMLSAQKLKFLYQITEGVSTFEFNEINNWRLFYRDKAGLPLTTPIDKGTVTTTVGGVTTTKTYFGTDRSEPGPSNDAASGFPKYCAKGGSSSLCIGKKGTFAPPPPAVSVWAQQAFIKAVNVDSEDQFGSGISLKNDTLAVGAFGEASNQNFITNGTTASSDNSKTYSGAVYVYKRTGNSWAQEAYIKAANSDANDFFGFSSGVSLDSDTLSVGVAMEASNQTTITNGSTASTDNSKSHSGAVYVYKRSGTNWAQEAYIKAVNADGNDYFGGAISLSGDTLASGANAEASNQTTITNGPTASANNGKFDSGAVYVYQRTGTNWAQQAYIKAVNADVDDSFGSSISLDGNTLAVAASQEDSDQVVITNGPTASANNLKSNSGAVYIYQRAGATWTQEAYIKSANARANDWAGVVSLSGDTLAVGVAAESSNQTTITNGTTASADISSSYSGAAYVYQRTAGVWAQQAYIKAVNADPADNFGGWLSLNGDVLAVAAFGELSNQTTITNGPTASSNNSIASGAVYVYRRSGTTWTQEAYIKAQKSEPMNFGLPSLNNNTLAVSTPGEKSNQNFITNGPGASTDSSLVNAGAVWVYKFAP